MMGSMVTLHTTFRESIRHELSLSHCFRFKGKRLEGIKIDEAVMKKEILVTAL